MLFQKMTMDIPTLIKALPASKGEIIALLSAGPTDHKATEDALNALLPCLALDEVASLVDVLLTSIRLPKVKIASLCQSYIADYTRIALDTGVIDSFAANHDVYSAAAGLFRKAIAWADASNMSFFSLRLQQDCIDTLIRSNDQALLNDALTAVEALVADIKDKDSDLQLVKAQTAAIEAAFRVGHTKKANTSMMSVRAQKVRLAPDIQGRLDYISGAVCMGMAQYAGASGYLQEAVNVGYPCVSQLLLTKILESRFSEIDNIIAQKDKFVAASGVDRERKYGRRAIAIDDALTPRIRDAALLLARPDSMHFLGRLNEIFDGILHAPCLAVIPFPRGSPELAQECERNVATEVRQTLHRLLVDNTNTHIKKLLAPYRRVELEHVGRLTGFPPERIKPLLAKMILTGDLAFRIDESNGCLVSNSTLKNNTGSGAAIHVLLEGRDTILAMMDLLDNIYSRVKY